MAVNRKEIAAALRDASTKINALSEMVHSLQNENKQLHEKLAGYSKDSNFKEKDDFFKSSFDKEASHNENIQYLGFGTIGEPEGAVSLSIEDRMNMILNGEYVD